MYYVIFNKNLKGVRLLLEGSKRYINDKNNLGQTLLDLALSMGELNIAKILLEEVGAEVKEKARIGAGAECHINPIGWAILEKKKPEEIEKLIKKVKKVNFFYIATDYDTPKGTKVVLFKELVQLRYKNIETRDKTKTIKWGIAT